MKKILIVLFGVFFIIPNFSQAAEIRDIAFPVQGGGTFTDDFGDARSNHAHAGNDIHADKMTPVLSATDGTVQWLTETEASYGWMMKIRDADGYVYHYIHLNNDTPGTDDGMGGREYAFAAGIEQGSAVSRGQVIAYVGDSGNAENIGSHLHFEIHLPDGTAINPYESLKAALGGSTYDIAAEKAASPDINADRGILTAATASACVSGTRVRTAADPAVYYCGADGKRYVFPNEKTYFTWFADFKGVVTITSEEMANLMIGGNVTYRPGVKLVKIQSDPKVYGVSKGGILRPIAGAAVAASLYGASWAKQVDDIPEAFFINYAIGESVV